MNEVNIKNTWNKFISDKTTISFYDALEKLGLNKEVEIYKGEEGIVILFKLLAIAEVYEDEIKKSL